MNPAFLAVLISLSLSLYACGGDHSIETDFSGVYSFDVPEHEMQCSNPAGNMVSQWRQQTYTWAIEQYTSETFGLFLPQSDNHPDLEWTVGTINSISGDFRFSFGSESTYNVFEGTLNKSGLATSGKYQYGTTPHGCSAVDVPVSIIREGDWGNSKTEI